MAPIPKTVGLTKLGKRVRPDERGSRRAGAALVGSIFSYDFVLHAVGKGLGPTYPEAT